MKIITTSTNNTLLSLLNNDQKAIVSELTWTGSYNSFCTVLIQNVSEHNVYVELWEPATVDSVIVEKKKSITLNNVDLSKVNLLASSATANCAILVSK